MDKVNDPEEAKAIDLPMANQAVFSSSWTAQDKELLPLWSIYTSGMQGVRIELPSNPFLGRCSPILKPGDRTYQLIAPETKKVDDTMVDLTVSREGVTESEHVTCARGPHEVRYSDRDEDRKLRCFEEDDDFLLFSLHPLGMTKLTHWAFEEEWRYRIFAIPPEGRIRKQDEPHKIDRFNLERFPVKDTYLDVLLDPDCLSRIKVTLGPKIVYGQQVLVESLLNVFAPNGECRKSEIAVK